MSLVSNTLAEPINISLNPPPANVRGHRHRRSAAISGDFDLSSFTKPTVTNTSTSLPCSPIKNLYLNSSSQNPLASLNDNTNDNTNNIQAYTESPEQRYTPTMEDDVQFRSSSNTNNSIPSNQLNTPLTSNYNNSSHSLSTPIKFYLTDDTKFSTNSNIPDALINLDDINSINSLIPPPPPQTPTLSLNKTFKKIDSPSFDIPYMPKHSLLYSPKKNDHVMIVEEIKEENSFTLMNSENSSTTSLTSNNQTNPFTNLNTSSITSLKGKVRYQSYYKLSPSIPKPPNNNRNSTAIQMSPIKQQHKPFQYQSLQYDLPDDFHENVALSHSRTNSHVEEKVENASAIPKIIKTSDQLKSCSQSIISAPSTNNDSQQSSVNLAAHSTNISDKENTNVLRINHNNSKSHERSSSIFSILSKKINHHKRRSSVLSSYSKANTQNIDDLTLNDITLTEDVSIGEPGEMINQQIKSTPKHASNTKKKGLFNWIVKSKKKST